MEPQIVSECLRFCIAELSLLFLPPPLPLAAVSDAHDSPWKVRRGTPGVGKDRSPERVLDAGHAARQGRHARGRGVDLAMDQGLLIGVWVPNGKGAVRGQRTKGEQGAGSYGRSRG